MKTRKSNKEKRFYQNAYLAELGSSDEEDLQTAAQDYDSDDGFVDNPADSKADDDDNFDNVDVDAVSESGSELPSETENLRPSKQRLSLAGGRLRASENAAVERAPGQVQPYPTDSSTKWTRSYVGPISRHVHVAQLCAHWYGDREGFQKVINAFVMLWTPYELFPPKLSRKNELKLGKSPWVLPTFWTDQQKKLVDWYFQYLSIRQVTSQSQLLQRTNAERWFLPKAGSELTAFLGPFNRQAKQTITQGQVIPLAYHGAPVSNEDASTEPTGGWMLDVGGITLSMDWAPRNGTDDQLLAMTVVPYSDQAFYQTPEEAPSEGSLKQGSVQIWNIPAQKDATGTMTFAKSQPHRAAALCFDGWGRAVRMQWCPVLLTVGNVIGLLAFLTTDRKVRVVEVKQSWNDRNKETFEEIREPLATLELKGEYKTDITCFTWMNMNRIAVGHTDGSVAVWSLHPCVMIQRHPVHSSPVMDIKSAYPSHPFIIASVPTGGVVTITDLNRPNAEMVYVPNLIVSFQPNLLSWSEHMRGFISLWPSSSPSNISLSFMAVRTWPQSRFVVAISGQPTCTAVGSCHPYLLVGSTDGTLWLCNPFRRVFFFKKKHRKIKVFQHDYQAIPAPDVANEDEDQEEVPRGICRILHDFKPQENSHPRHDKSGVQMRRRHDAQKKKEQQKRKKSKGKAKKEVADEEPDEDVLESDLEQDFEGGGIGDVLNSDPLSRISAVAWNPNVECSWWAAAAMASGLVRIMDLGEKQVSLRKSREEDEEDVSEDEDIEDGLSEQVEHDVFGDGDFEDEASDVIMED